MSPSHEYPLAALPRIREAHHEAARRLDGNFDGKIINPIGHYRDDDLSYDVETFFKEHILAVPSDYNIKDSQIIDHLELFQRAAKVARNAGSAGTLAALKEDERTTLQNENKQLWKQPWKLYLTLIACSFGAIVQGWSQTGINGANTSFKQDLHFPDANVPGSVKFDWLFGLVNSATYFAAALIGCLFVDPLNDFIKGGRRGTIFISAIFSFISPIGSAVCQTWYQVLATRILLGIGMGLKASTIPIYAAEISPTKIRGSVVMFWQLFDAFGIFLAYCANLIVFDTGALAWRLQIGSSFLPAVPLLALIYFCPESPRWFVKQNRIQEAYQSIRKLKGNELLAARDIYLLYKQVELEDLYLARYKKRGAQEVEAGEAQLPKSTYFRRVQQLGSLGRIRRATVASFAVMLSQQMCGINIISFYSSQFFLDLNTAPGAEPTESNRRKALLFAFGTGLCNFLFTLPAIRQIDTLGRRKLLLWTFPAMAVLLLATGFSYSSHGPQKLPLSVTFTLLFVAVYSVGGGPVPFTYSAESFPLSHREVGMGAAVAVNLFFAGLLALVFPRMNSRLGAAGALGVFCGLNFVAFFMIFFLVPETSQCSLEDLDFRFLVKTEKHVKHQLTTLEWYVKGKRKGESKPSLYFMDDGLGDDAGMGEMREFREGDDLSQRDSVSMLSVVDDVEGVEGGKGRRASDVSGTSVHATTVVGGGDGVGRSNSRASHWY